jgi:hypothetical protein
MAQKEEAKKVALGSTAVATQTTQKPRKDEVVKISFTYGLNDETLFQLLFVSEDNTQKMVVKKVNPQAWLMYQWWLLSESPEKNPAFKSRSSGPTFFRMRRTKRYSSDSDSSDDSE